MSGYLIDTDWVIDVLHGNPDAEQTLLDLAPGCLFRDRCAAAALVPDDRCRTTRPDLTVDQDGHARRCHLAPAQMASLRTTHQEQ